METKLSINPKKKIYNKKISTKIGGAQKNLKLYSQNALRWAFLYVNDNKDVNVSYAWIMKWIICYDSSILVLNPKTKVKQGLFLYNNLIE